MFCHFNTPFASPCWKTKLSNQSQTGMHQELASLPSTRRGEDKADETW